MHDIEVRRMYAKVTATLFGEPSAPVRIGRYRVEARLGSGAMGVVYAAVDERLGRRLAIKLLHESFAGDPTGRARLLREAQAMARLRHENVVLIYDVGTHAPGGDDEQVFIAMELVEGRTLDRWLREAPRSPDDILTRFIQAGRALSAAHRAGVLHRDFKPENVLVDLAGRVRVLDFGLARALADADPEDSLSTPLTRTGSILGTPAYMAPEQLRGGPIDARADQFSFCVALYEALYDHRPFAAVARFAPVVVSHVPKASRVPAGLRRALLRGLSEAPGDRWPDMDTLLVALRPPPAHNGLALVGLLLALGAGLGAWVAATLRPPPGLDLASAARHIRESVAAPGPPVVASTPATREPIFDPVAGKRELQLRDSRRAARFHPLLARDPTAAALLLRELPDDCEGVAGMRRQALARPLTRFRVTTEGLRLLWFAADGDLWLADASGVRHHDREGRQVPAPADSPVPASQRLDPGLHLWPAPDGGKPLRRELGRLTLGRQRLREHDGELTAVAWSPDGRHVAVAGTQVLVWDRRGELRARDAGHEGSVRALRWSPTGDRLLIGGDDGQIRIVRLDDDGEPRVLLGHTAAISDLAWHPDGDRVASAASDGSVRVWSLVPGALARLEHPGAVQDLRWRPDSSLLATASDDGKVRLFAGDGRGQPQILGHGRRVLAVAWHPEGDQLASGGADGSMRVWAADGTPLRELPTGGHGDITALTWTPAGDLLAASIDDRVLFWPAGEAPAQPVQAPRVTLLGLAVRPVPLAATAPTPGAPLELISDSVGGPARRWTFDLSEGTARLRDAARLGDVNDLAWCDDGVLALARDDRRVDLLAPDGTVDLRRTGASVTSVACGREDDAGLVAGLIDGRIRGWSRRSARDPAELTGHVAAVDALAFRPDGELLASADAAGRLYLWPWTDAAIARQLRAATLLCLDAAQRVSLLGESSAQAAQAATTCEPPR